MQIPKISMIAAIATKDRAIGFQNQLLWHIPEDFKHFKETTLGHAIIMGENTYRSIGRPLPNRTNIVLSQDKGFVPEGCSVVRSVEEALEKARSVEPEEVFVCGGASVYRQFLPYADRLYLTLVEGEYEADTFFPDYGDFSRELSWRASQDGTYRYSFVTLERELTNS
jgi:dihydrofolate reductase